MENNLNPILNFRKQLKKDTETKSSLKEKKTQKNSAVKLFSTMITETRESVDSSENS